MDMTEFSAVNFKLHTSLCINYFESFVGSTASHMHPSFSSDDAVIQSTVISVYEGCIYALKQALLLISSVNVKKDSTAGPEAINIEAWTSIQELMLITSYCYTSASQNLPHHRNNKSADHCLSSSARGNGPKSAFDFVYRNKESIYPKDVLLLLSPYWAVVLSTYFAAYPIFVRSAESEQGSEEEGEEETEIDSSSPKQQISRTQHKQSQYQIGLKEVIVLLSRPHFLDLVGPFLEDVIRYLSVSQTQHLEHSTSYSLYARLKRVMKSKLKTPLFLGVTLALAVHTSNIQFCFAQKNGDRDHDSVQDEDVILIQAIHMMIRSSPMLGMQQDLPLLMTPLAMVATHRITTFTDAASIEKVELYEQLDLQFTLALTQILGKYTPSAMVMSDRSGLLPSHHAARRGHSDVMLFLCGCSATSGQKLLQANSSFTVTWRDQTGKTPFHHALLSWQQHVKYHLTTEQLQHQLVRKTQVLETPPDYKSRLMFERQQQVKNNDTAPLVKLAKMYPEVLNPDEDRGYKTLHYIHSHLPADLQSIFTEIWQEYEAQSLLFTTRKVDCSSDHFEQDRHTLDAFHYSANTTQFSPSAKMQFRSIHNKPQQMREKLDIEQETSHMNAILLHDRRQRDIYISKEKKTKRRYNEDDDEIMWEEADQTTNDTLYGSDRGPPSKKSTSSKQKVTKGKGQGNKPKLSTLTPSQDIASSGSSINIENDITHFGTIMTTTTDDIPVMKRKRGRPRSTTNIAKAADSLLFLLSSSTQAVNTA